MSWKRGRLAGHLFGCPGKLFPETEKRPDALRRRKKRKRCGCEKGGKSWRLPSEGWEGGSSAVLKGRGGGARYYLGEKSGGDSEEKGRERSTYPHSTPHFLEWGGKWPRFCTTWVGRGREGTLIN